MDLPEFLEGQTYFLLAERRIILAALRTWQQFLYPVLGSRFPGKIISELTAGEILRAPLQVKDLVKWPEVFLGILVAIQAPTHAV